MNRVPAIVAFDFGGVLVDVDKSVLATTLSLSARDVDDAFFGSTTHDDMACGRITGADFCRQVAHRADRAAVDVEVAWRNVVRVRAGACELVDDVRVRTVGWSNTDPHHISALSGGLPASLLDVDTRALSFELGVQKPSADFFHRALERLRVHANDVVFLDDREENVGGARALGINAHCVASVDSARRQLVLRGVLRDR